MFFMRQTIIVMSRHIEYDQKNEVFDHYQKLSTAFYKSNSTGDMMSRISEDVSRVRMYTGPAIMYVINLMVLIALCMWKMISVSPSLTLYVAAPLPILALSIFVVNKIVNKKSEQIQAELSGLTSQAQESYSGIRVIKSFRQEESAINLFAKISGKYRKSTINLSMTEAFYFPAMNLFIGLSMILTVLVGGWQAIEGNVSTGNIAEFVIYINLLMFPISAIGWTANMIQRAAVSQRRINEFLLATPEIVNSENAKVKHVDGTIEFKNVSQMYL
jgi:ATP-binding cassette subfamily B protein